MKKITIGIVSRSLESNKQVLLNNIEETCGIDYNLIFITNNDGMSLSKLYHNIVETSPTDIVVLIHDDIEFIKKNWGSDIYEIFQRNNDYSIIGVAGSAEFNDECTWWKYSNIYGQVLHKKDDKYWLSMFSKLYEHDLEEVCVIDGVFMAIRKDRLIYNFNEDINGFHMYDIDFCLHNFLTRKTKIGVTTKIRLAHYSIGELDEEWFISREKILDKYKNYFPIKIEKHDR